MALFNSIRNILYSSTASVRCMSNEYSLLRNTLASCWNNSAFTNQYIRSTSTTSNVEHNDIPATKDDILTDYENRNPRNLEMLRIARQPKGHWMDQTLVNYWYSLELKKRGQNIIGQVRHHTGKVVIHASTAEWALASRLPSTADRCAVIAVADVLARRCLEAGITEMSSKLHKEAETSPKASLFLKTMSENGIKLTEDFQIHEADMYPFAKENPVTPWQVTEEDVAALDYRKNMKPLKS